MRHRAEHTEPQGGHSHGVRLRRGESKQKGRRTSHRRPTAGRNALPSAEALKGLTERCGTLEDVGELLTEPHGPHSPSRAMTSTSITAQPRSWNTWATELLPEAMPPVRPTRNIFPGKRESVSPRTRSWNHRCCTHAADGNCPPWEGPEDRPVGGEA